LPPTPDSVDPRLARIRTEPPKLIRVTREGWSSLLGSLTGDELVRYQQIALDQYKHECRYRWAQAAMLVLAAASAVASARGIILWGYSRTGVFTLGLSALLSYWPYRSAKVRRLWWQHYVAVQDEQKRREAPKG
jgi:hypothetical protein